MPLRRSKVTTHVGDKDFYLKILKDLDPKWVYAYSIGPTHYYRLEVYD